MAEKIIDQKICVTCGMSGYFAVHRVLVTDETGDEKYWDVQNTGIGRYRTSKKAAIEAIQWAQAEELPIGFDPKIYGPRIVEIAQKLGVKQWEDSEDHKAMWNRVHNND